MTNLYPIDITGSMDSTIKRALSSRTAERLITGRHFSRCGGDIGMELRICIKRSSHGFQQPIEWCKVNMVRGSGQRFLNTMIPWNVQRRHSRSRRMRHRFSHSERTEGS